MNHSSSDAPVEHDIYPAEGAQPLGKRVLINTGALTSSSLWRIGVSFVLQLLIARVLGVRALGVYTVALAYLNVGQVVSELGLPALLTRDLASRPRQRRAYFRASLRFQAVASLAVWTGLAALAVLLPYGAEARWALILIGASLPLYAVTSAAETQFRAAERMELVMGVEMFVNLLILLVSVALLVSGATVMPLIGVLVVTQAASAVTCAIILRQAHIFAPPQDTVEVRALALWRRTAAFFWLSIVEVLQQRLDILLLSIVAGPTVTGVYSAAYNLVRVVIKLIQSYWQALYPTFSRIYIRSDERYQTLSDLSLRYGLLVLLPTAAITSGVSEELTRLIYTNAYDASAPVLRWLIWIAPVVFVESFAGTQLLVHRRPRHSIAVAGANLAALLAALPLLAGYWGATGAAWASLLAASAGAIVGWAFLRSHGFQFNNGEVARMAVAAIVAVLLAAQLPVDWIVGAGIAAAAYVLIIWAAGVVSSEDIARVRRSIRPNTP